jgi:diguanylate cyclase (GGDEF)-like protein
MMDGRILADKWFERPKKQALNDWFCPMKRLIPTIPIIFACASAAWAAPPAALTTLHAVHALSHADAVKEPAVAFEATVTYRRAHETTLFVEDGSEGLYVWAKDVVLAPGDRVLVRGKAQDSFRPIVLAESVTVLRHGAMPAPVPATFDELMRFEHDGVRVSVRGVVQSADLGLNADHNDSHLVLIVDGGTIDTYVDSDDGSVLNGLLDAEVEIAGVASARFDGKMQPTGIGLSVPSIADVKILKRASTSPWSLPLTPMDGIVGNYRVMNESRRIRVHGTITYYQPGSALVLQNGTKSLWIATVFEKPLRVGELADVTGFPDVHEGFLTLSGGEIQESPVYAPIAPQLETGSELTSSKHIFDLVSIQGQVVMEARENSQDEYVLLADGRVFSAIYRHPDVSGLQPIPMNPIPVGSQVRVSGICILDNSNPYRGDVPFDILMRTPGDIAVLARPSLLTVRNLILMVCFLLAVVVAVGARGWAIEHKTRRHTTELAYIERRRRHILEDINGSRPLAEIVEEITELVSFRLKGAACWCQIADGAKLGNCPRNLSGLRTASREIPARSGPALGTLFAAFDPLTKAQPLESETLEMAAGLATLAIETRRLYSDLRHRSEFDLLTDIHNRFSLDEHLDALIAEAREKGSVFGLIYIDLDKFKQINDLYGHRIGDLYLQDVALRMKRQLRSHDTLARVGGDEFAVLVPVLHSLVDVKEIAQRLERCFDDPFAVEGYTLQGAASVGIALYPEDGTTKDSLLSAADAAMYAAKNKKRSFADRLNAELAPVERA